MYTHIYIYIYHKPCSLMMKTPIFPLASLSSSVAGRRRVSGYQVTLPGCRV